jgi:hypothetical protein
MTVDNRTILGMLELLPSSIPLFIGAFVSDDIGYIGVLTQTGGENRSPYYVQNEELRNHPLHIGDEDVEGEEPKALFTFDIPEKFIEPLKASDFYEVRRLLEPKPVDPDKLTEEIERVLSDSSITLSMKIFRLVSIANGKKYTR